MTNPVCLPLEIKNRDLDGRLYLAAKCVEAGHPVLLGLRSRIRRFFRKDLAGPVYYISKGNNPDLAAREKIKKKGGHVFLLDEEGGGSLSFDGDVCHGFIANQHMVDKVFAWGDLQSNYMIKKGAAPELLLTTGNPRFDLYKPTKSNFYKILSKRLPIPKKFILIASNQVGANPLLSVEHEKAHLQEMLGDSFDETEFNQRYQKECRQLSKLIKLTRRLAVTYPDTSIVFRPHPVENMSYYEGLFHEDNIMVTNEGSSVEWIVNASAFVHIDCTTGIEAFIAGLDVISYVPLKNEDELFEAPLVASSVVYTQQEVVKLVGTSLKNKGLSSLSFQQRREKEDKLSQLIANFKIESTPIILDSLKNFPCGSHHPPLRPKSFVYRTAKKLRKLWKGDRLKATDLRVKQKFPGLSMDEVRQRVIAIREVEPNIPPIKIREYDIDTFLLEPK